MQAILLTSAWSNFDQVCSRLESINLRVIFSIKLLHHFNGQLMGLGLPLTKLVYIASMCLDKLELVTVCL